MLHANELIHVADHLRFWQFYDPAVKAELFSTALKTQDSILIVDPIPLSQELMKQLADEAPTAGIFVTNANHCRSAVNFAEKFGAPVFAHEITCAACDLSSAHAVADGENLVRDVRAIEISGAVSGEMALYQTEDGGSLIIGDALINFEPYGFTFLPQKYCSNAKEMRRSLRRLLDCQFERMLFAHGTPLMHSARKKLEELLYSAD
jgi:glyoxylase-like metal-dependent hydrolase (beta-lactamase superfamily II)